MDHPVNTYYGTRILEPTDRSGGEILQQPTGARSTASKLTLDMLFAFEIISLWITSLMVSACASCSMIEKA